MHPTILLATMIATPVAGGDGADVEEHCTGILGLEGGHDPTASVAMIQ